MLTKNVLQHITYPLSLTDPDAIPLANTVDPHPLPPAVSSSALFNQALAQIQSIIANTIFGNNTCARCQSILQVLKFVSLAAPEEGPNLTVAICEAYKLSSNCTLAYGSPTGLGAAVTQVIAQANVAGYDGQVCRPHYLSSDIYPLSI